MTRRVLPLLLVFAFTGALPGQVPSKARIDSLLQAASNAFDHNQTLAPSIRSNHAKEKMLRDSCNRVLEMLGRDVQDAKKNIARYRALAAPQSVDLFDIFTKSSRRSWKESAISGTWAIFTVRPIGRCSLKPTTVS
jgi:hypothetical protein